MTKLTETLLACARRQSGFTCGIERSQTALLTEPFGDLSVLADQAAAIRFGRQTRSQGARD